MPGRGLPHPIMVLIGFLLLCLVEAGIGVLVAWPSMGHWYADVRRPPGAMPPWTFPAVWGPLALCRAVAAWRIWRATRRPPRHRALLLWGWQMFAGILWCGCFFGLHRLQPATALVLFCLLLTGLALRDFRRVDRAACVLMAPSLAWVCYATWLTAGIAWLNPA